MTKRRGAAAKRDLSQGKLIREQMEKARASGEQNDFLRLAGTVSGPKELSRRKGFMQRAGQAPRAGWNEAFQAMDRQGDGWGEVAGAGRWN